jgi:single-stranded-DNA-specific exonuclease
MDGYPKNWIPRGYSSEYIFSQEYFSDIKKSLDICDILLKILAGRGITSEENISNFLNPVLSKLHKSSLMPGIENAVTRLKFAIAKNQKVIIYGDYDTDGVISTAILYNFLKKSGLNIDYYLPDRFEEGYDINTGFIKKTVIPGKYDLVICVDCGTNANDVRDLLVKYKERKIDVIVCDHHEPVSNTDLDEGSRNIESSECGNSSAPQYIIMNPKIKGSNYPFKYLSGAGVVFKFICHAINLFDSQLQNKVISGFHDIQNYLRSIIDLVAISTVADMMPLIDENRIIVSFGLKNLYRTANKGLKKMLEKNFKKIEDFNTYDVGFIISPRLNASGRVGNAYSSIKLLVDDITTEEEHQNLIDILESFNLERQNIQSKMLSEILEKIISAAGEIPDDKKIFISSSPEWNEGVLGIVASQLVKKINLPVLLFKEKKGMLKGSGRSTESFNLYENLERFRNYFIKFGGHSQACGITMHMENYKEFKKELEKHTDIIIKPEEQIKKIYFDAEIDFSDINDKLINGIEKLKPFGTGNPKPVFKTTNCRITGKPSVFDGRKQKAKHMFFDIENNKRILSAALFDYLSVVRKPSADEILRSGSQIDILYTIDKKMQNNGSVYQNGHTGGTVQKHPGLQIVIVDYCLT